MELRDAALVSAVIDRQSRFATDFRSGKAKRFAHKQLAPVASDLLGYNDSSATVQSVDPKAVSATFIISTQDEDREGDTIIQRGIHLENYLRNPVALWDHNIAETAPPIGVWKNVTLGDTQSTATWFADQGDPDAMFLFGKVERGIIKACSVGIIPLKGKKNGDGFLIEECDLAEISLCAVGMNAGALRISSTDRVSDWLRKSLTTQRKNAIVTGGYDMSRRWGHGTRAKSKPTQETEMNADELKAALAENNAAIMKQVQDLLTKSHEPIAAIGVQVKSLASDVAAIKTKAETVAGEGNKDKGKPDDSGKPGPAMLLALKEVHDEHAPKQEHDDMVKMCKGLRKLCMKAEEAYGGTEWKKAVEILDAKEDEEAAKKEKEAADKKEAEEKSKSLSDDDVRKELREMRRQYAEALGAVA
jgi:HK97 family phage prohead protease